MARMEIPRGFKNKEALKMIEKLPSLRMRTLMREKLQQYIRRT